MTKRVTIEALAEWLRDRDVIALMGHVSPDGDAVGSCLALKLALQALGIRAVVCLPGGVPKIYGFLPGAGEALPTGAELPFAPKAALAVDASDESRLGDEGRALFNACSEAAALDHHGTNLGMGGRYTLDDEAAATGELALQLIDALCVPLSKEMAECLFVAISTDCGQFAYANTRPETFAAAARCVGAGIDLSGITQRLYRTRSPGRTKLLGLVLSGLELSSDGRIAWARLTEGMLDEAHALREDNEGIVNYLLEIEGVSIAVLAEQRGAATKLSLRSVAPVDVAAGIAVPLGGGGHSNAAGATLDADMESALDRALTLARRALDAL